MSLKYFRVAVGSIAGEKKFIKAKDFKSLKIKACEEWGLVPNKKVQIYDETGTEVNDENFGILRDFGSLLYLEIKQSDEFDSRRIGHQFNANNQANPLLSEEKKTEKLRKDLKKILEQDLSSMKMEKNSLAQ